MDINSMKISKIILTVTLLSLSCPLAFAQTNTFPSTGAAGIGTTNPRNTLDVRGILRMGGVLQEMGSTTNANRAILFFSKGANSTVPDYAHDAGRIYGSHPPYDIGGSSGGWNDQALVFEAANNWGQFSSWQLVLKGNGNVGIGTDSPDYKLDVSGTLRAKEVIVETGWSDFVFDDLYELRSIEEVECHILEYGHLPDVPSAAEIKSNGLSVGQAQKVMMQKIEELTLYLIEQNKAIDDLRKENVRFLEVSESLFEELSKLRSKEGGK